MAEGIVAYERGAAALGWSTRAWDRIATAEPPGERMVRILHYQREEAADWLDKAEQDLQVVRSTDPGIGLQVRCYRAQAAAEKAIKTLLVAHGQPVACGARAAQPRRRAQEDRRNTPGRGDARAPGAAGEVRRRSAVPALAGSDDRRGQGALLPARHRGLRPRTSASAADPRCAFERRTRTSAGSTGDQASGGRQWSEGPDAELMQSGSMASSSPSRP